MCITMVQYPGEGYIVEEEPMTPLTIHSSHSIHGGGDELISNVSMQ